VIRLETEQNGRVRVIGSLLGAAPKLLLDAIAHGAVVFDLSGVDRADDTAVRLLAELSPDHVELDACPTWLALWLERERHEAGRHS